jgi:hypothetical protein
MTFLGKVSMNDGHGLKHIADTLSVSLTGVYINSSPRVSFFAPSGRALFFFFLSRAAFLDPYQIYAPFSQVKILVTQTGAVFDYGRYTSEKRVRESLFFYRRQCTLFV